MSVRVLYTIPNFITAGSGRVVYNMALRLDRRLFEPAVAVLKSGASIEQEFAAAGVRVFEAPFMIAARPAWSLPWRCAAAARDLREFHGAIWHSWHYADDYTEPIIARFAGAKAWIYTKKAMGWGSRAWRVRSYLATRIVADNHDMRALMFARRAFRRKLSVIPHGVAADRFAPDTPARLGLRARLSIPADAVVVCCVAHLVPVKGHPTLLRALAGVPEMHLLIAGKPMDRDYASSLERMTSELGLNHRVHFLGGVSDIPALHAESDVFGFPSRPPGEGCPVALLEAMSSGKACVATDIPGSRDLVENGRSGLLVAPEDANALAEALRRLATSPELRRSLGAAARQRVLDRFTVEREAAAHEALYRQVLGLA